MLKRILITGGAGFIGSKLCLKLISRGYQVTILDNLSPQIHSAPDQLLNLLKDSIFIQGDVRNELDLIKALHNQDAVIHLAAETGTGQSMYNIDNYVDVNIKGSALILDLIANKKIQGIKKLIIASSRAIYGEGKYLCDTHGYVYPASRLINDMVNKDFEIKCPECGTCVNLVATDEKSQIHPSSIYGITKQVQEQMFLNIGMALNIPTVAYRYQNVYGPGQSLSNPYTGILSIFSTRIRNNNPINIFEDGKESRDFVYIDDVVDATIMGLESEQANYQVFNVGYGNNINVYDIAKRLIECYNINVPIGITGNFRLGDIRHNYADITKITNTLGFQPKIDINTGLKLFVNWVLTQDIAQDNYLDSLHDLKNKGFLK